ncbi:MAG: DUF2270 domain-containing protein [Alphaproteobacteria bacterium]|nr:MAG: DUF2270 domain-containing protein [Alphaproteobacteria bacterium]
MDNDIPQQPGLPATPGENTTAMVHYYRAEMARMTSWRDRLDRTTNWAITVVAALLSVSLSTPTAHHGVLLFALLLVSLLLYVEGRRYRFYDVYRMRVRQFERHYFAQSFAAQTVDDSKAPWLDVLAQDLRHPRFRIDFPTALSRRLKRNYIWLYVILLLGWLLKITSPALTVEGAVAEGSISLASVVSNAALGPVPGAVVVAVVAAWYVALGLASLRTRRADDDEVHV